MSSRLHNVLRDTEPTGAAALFAAGLSALTPLYAGAVASRNALFDWGCRRSHRLPRPTVSVGNLTTGGTGKTPMVIDLVERMRAMGRQPAVLLRGYSRAGEASDEATMYVTRWGDDVPIAADPDRMRGAATVLAARPEVDLFILDDGFQHRQVHRDVDLVLIDATAPFGAGLLPRGLRREPTGALRRADAVVLTRCDLCEAATLEHTERRISLITGRPPAARTVLDWARLHAADGTTQPLASLATQRVLAVVGIGNPLAFQKMLHRHAGPGSVLIVQPDHHPYQPQELTGYLDRARQEGFDAVLTTDKDWAKWQPLLGGDQSAVAILRPELALRYLSGKETILRQLQQLELCPKTCQNGSKRASD